MDGWHHLGSPAEATRFQQPAGAGPPVACRSAVDYWCSLLLEHAGLLILHVEIGGPPEWVRWR
ncbi:hypothetical protein Sros01_74280 [Streptomyces roseochromogenus]|nr:hypothetical protein Sros01_74280 [Streptomyces roseochromogenus]